MIEGIWRGFSVQRRSGHDRQRVRGQAILCRESIIWGVEIYLPFTHLRRRVRYEVNVP